MLMAMIPKLLMGIGVIMISQLISKMREFNFWFYIDIEPSELERLKRLYKGENKKRHSLREGRENRKGDGISCRLL